MLAAGRPITPEADLVQRWYDALCSPSANQAPLYLTTWRGEQSDEQLQRIVDAYRAANGYTEGCTAIVNPNIIYFEAIPSELQSTVERIKFVAVRVFLPDQPHDDPDSLAVGTSVHVLFLKNGTVKILPYFMPESPLGIYTGLTPITLYNNDGLVMGQVQLNGSLIQIPESDFIRLGIPLQMSTARNWGGAWIRIYADDLEVTTEPYAHMLPTDLQAGFLPRFLEPIAANQVVQGIIWFTAPHLPADIRLSIDATQTGWDMPGIPMMLKVQ